MTLPCYASASYRAIFPRNLSQRNQVRAYLVETTRRPRRLAFDANAFPNFCCCRISANVHELATRPNVESSFFDFTLNNEFRSGVHLSTFTATTGQRDNYNDNHPNGYFCVTLDTTK